jgi:hypothetical protein
MEAGTIGDFRKIKIGRLWIGIIIIITPHVLKNTKYKKECEVDGIIISLKKIQEEEIDYWCDRASLDINNYICVRNDVGEATLWRQ